MDAAAGPNQERKVEKGSEREKMSQR